MELGICVFYPCDVVHLPCSPAVLRDHSLHNKQYFSQSGMPNDFHFVSFATLFLLSSCSLIPIKELHNHVCWENSGSHE